tara:strand:- start:391 stop:1032 length:642 start_codon:yes stop_codon:yes gene_type:complete
MTNSIETLAATYFSTCVKTETNLVNKMNKAILNNPAMIREIAQSVFYADKDSMVFCEKKKADKADMALRRTLYATSAVGDITYLLERNCRNDLKAFRIIGEKSSVWSENTIVAICEHTKAKGAHGLMQASNTFYKAIEKEYLAPEKSDDNGSDDNGSDDNGSDEKAPDLSLQDIADKLLISLGNEQAYKLSVLLADMAQDNLSDTQIEKAIAG